MRSGGFDDLPSVEQLNGASRDEFAAALAPLFEGAPRFLGRLADARPFSSEEDLFTSARSVAATMPEDDQVELLGAHPRIGARPEAVSAMSHAEQGYGAPQADDDRGTAARLRELNERYEARFGFRFVIFVAGRPRRDIVPLIERALDADRNAELQRGLGDVVSIAEDRLAKLRARRARHPVVGA